METAYYESQLDKAERAVYAALRQGLSTLAPVIRVPRLSDRALGDVFTVLRLDHPEIFYAEGFRLRWMPGAEEAELLVQYLFEKSKLLTHRAALRARVERLTRAGKTLEEWGRLRLIHDFLCEGVRYDKLKKDYSHEIIGPLTQGVGVCEGMAKTVKILCDALELPCIVALSAAEEGQRYGHAWNVIRLGGKWYQFDMTFDNSLSRCGVTRYDYCALDDRRFYADHRPPAYPLPPCNDANGFYYRVERLSFTKKEEVASRVAQSVRKKRGVLVFHWRGGYLTREVLAELLEVIRAAAESGGRHAGVSVNWAQAVFCVRILDAPPSAAVELESSQSD